MKTSNTPKDAALREALRRLEATPREGRSTGSFPPFFRRIAAIFLAAAVLGGLAWAITPLFISSTPETKQPAQAITPLPHSEEQGGESSIRFSNVRLDSILNVVAGHYGKVVRYRSEEPRAMKLITTWNPADSLPAFIEHLNMFDYLHLSLEGNTIFVESVAEEDAR